MKYLSSRAFLTRALGVVAAVVVAGTLVPSSPASAATPPKWQFGCNSEVLIITLYSGIGATGVGGASTKDEVFFHPDCTVTADGANPISAAEEQGFRGKLWFYVGDNVAAQDQAVAWVRDVAVEFNQRLPKLSTDSRPLRAWDAGWGWAGWWSWDLGYTAQNGTTSGVGGSYNGGQHWGNGSVASITGQAVGDANTDVAGIAGCVGAQSGDIYGWMNPWGSLTTAYYNGGWHSWASGGCFVGGGTSGGAIGAGVAWNVDFRVNVTGNRIA